MGKLEKLPVQLVESHRDEDGEFTYRVQCPTDTTLNMLKIRTMPWFSGLIKEGYRYTIDSNNVVYFIFSSDIDTADDEKAAYKIRIVDWCTLGIFPISYNCCSELYIKRDLPESEKKDLLNAYFACLAETFETVKHAGIAKDVRIDKITTQRMLNTTFIHGPNIEYIRHTDGSITIPNYFTQQFHNHLHHKEIASSVPRQTIPRKPYFYLTELSREE